MDRILVTGGCGFIGANFIDYWARRHPKTIIVNVDLLTYAGDSRHMARFRSLYPERVVSITADIADAAAMRPIMVEWEPEAIVHFAAESHNSRAIGNPETFVRTNVIGTLKLLELARSFKVERFHHVSTDEVYGELALDDKTTGFTEDSPYRPLNPYSASKASADHLVRAFGQTYGLPYTISNCCNNYGRWQFPEKLIPLSITNLLDGQPMTLYRSSQNRREWLHVDDHCRAIELILERGRTGRTYNVGSGFEASIETVADTILGGLQQPASMKHYVPDRPQHDSRYLLNSARIRQELNWQPAHRFGQGLIETIEWYRANREWWEPLKTRQQVNEAAWSGQTNTAHA